MKEHPGLDAISSLLDGQAAPEASRDLRRHLAECAHCRHEAEEIARINALLGGWFDYESAPEPPDLLLPPWAENTWRADVVKLLVFVLLTVLSYAAWHHITIHYAGILDGMKQLVYGHIIHWLGQIPAVAARILSEPAVINRVLFRGLLESGGLMAALGMIYAMHKSVRAGRSGRNGKSAQAAAWE